MILFKQTHVQDGQICGSLILDGDSIGEFRVTVPQWDELRQHEVDELLVWNEDQAKRQAKRQAEVEV